MDTLKESVRDDFMMRRPALSDSRSLRLRSEGRQVECSFFFLFRIAHFFYLGDFYLAVERQINYVLKNNGSP